jgi:uroporphyrinogen-III decarboxylase
MRLKVSKYFDLERYQDRVDRNRQRWDEFMRGERQVLAFMNLCAPSLCTMFGVGFGDYYTDLATMADTQLRGIAWRLANLDEDEIPEAVFLDQGTLHEAIAFNLPVEWRPDSPPWGGRYILDAPGVDRLVSPSFLGHRGLSQTRERLEQLREIVVGIPVLASVHLHAPFTMAAQLIGSEQLYLLCSEEPARAHALIKSCLSYFKLFEEAKLQYGISPDPLDEFVCWRGAQRGMSRIWVSDDSAPAISPGFYKSFVFPYNQALFATYQYIHLHMDGKWDHLLPLVAKLSPAFVEVGGETDWTGAIQTLGPGAILQGGVSGSVGLSGTPADCASAAESSLESTADPARVVITIAQEPYPGTPVENMQAILNAVRRWENQKPF